MRENSGSGRGQNDSRDPTLKDNAGTRPAGVGDDVEGASTSFDVAADHEAAGGKRSPSARGRGDGGTDTDAPNIS